MKILLILKIFSLYLVYWSWTFMLHSYFKRKYDKVLTFNIVHFPNFEISAFLLLASHLAVSKFNKRWGHLLDEIRHLQYEECFGFHRVANVKESRLCARPYPTQDKLLTAFHSALNMFLSKEITLSHIVYSS